MSFLRSLFIGTLLGALIVPGLAAAQVSTPGTPYALQAAAPAGGPGAVPTVDLERPPRAPAPSVARAQSGASRLLPAAYGQRIETAIDVKADGRRQRLANGGTLWRVRIRVATARRLRLAYDRFRLPPEATLFAYDPAGTVVQGAFTARNNAPHGGFSTGFTPGHTTILEYYEPPHPAFAGQVRVAAVIAAGSPARPPAPTSSKAAYAPTSLSCSVNATCPAAGAWTDASRATVLIDRGGSTCSGVLLNNTADDFTPYILTAHHCGQPAVGDTLDWRVSFNYASPTCDDPSAEPPKNTMTGVVVRAAHSGWREDYALLELVNPIPASYAVRYAGWSRDEEEPPAHAATLGHPRGDIQKIAFDNDPLTDLGARWLSTIDRGSVEGGSSGSPLFDDAHRFIGHLRGAWSIDLNACTGPGGDDNGATLVYPKLAHVWDAGPPGQQIRDFLDPAGLDPMQWDGLDAAPAAAGKTQPWINEIDTRTADVPADDGAEFVELAGPAGQSLDGYRLDVYACRGGAAALQFTTPLGPDARLSAASDGTGYFVVGPAGGAAGHLHQPFAAIGPDRLPDGRGLLILRSPRGHEVFDYQYDRVVDGQPQACPASRTTRSRADDYRYEAPTAPTSSEAKTALGSTAAGFSDAFFPAADAQAAEGIVPSPGRANDTAMPVELAAFRALVDGATVQLTWTTSSETRNAGFAVQHAMAGEFVTRAFVDGRGTTTQSTTYRHAVTDLLTGTHRFRLRQVDTDGTTSFSPVIDVTVASDAAYALSAPHPNPFRDAAALTLTVAQPQHVEARLYDVLGRRVAVLHDGTASAQRPIPLRVDGRSLSSGLYVVRVVGERFAATRKVTLLR